MVYLQKSSQKPFKNMDQPRYIGGGPFPKFCRGGPCICEGPFFEAMPEIRTNFWMPKKRHKL